MKIVECEQGTTAWSLARLGRVTASQMHRIITPTGKLSSQCDAYAHELIFEQVTGTPVDNATSGFMQRGTIVEKKARAFYELQRDCTVEEVGFVTRDDGLVGCSPDGLVGRDRGVEIKVPAGPTHIGYLIGDAGEKYKLQIQTCLWVCERAHWDFVTYNPDLPSAIVTFDRDDALIAKIDVAVAQFLEHVSESKHKLQQQYGMFPELQRPDLKVVA